MTALLTGITFILWSLQLLGLVTINATLLGIFALVTGILWLVTGLGVAVPNGPTLTHRNPQ
jgi:hypothetical protein